jgi:hypothetical protein
MPDKTGGSSGRRERRRHRGLFETKTGKAIGFSSIAAPLIGFVVNDLKKPDSIVRGLIGAAATKLLGTRSRRAEVIDITDKVKIVDEGNESNDSKDNSA